MVPVTVLEEFLLVTVISFMGLGLLPGRVLWETELISFSNEKLLSKWGFDFNTLDKKLSKISPVWLCVLPKTATGQELRFSSCLPDSESKMRDLVCTKTDLNSV